MAIKLGSTTINGLYLGSTAINKAYLGATEVFTTSGAFTPASLFASGEKGAWYDPSDLMTMWTDTAGTTQATVGDEVARIDDKSGNGNHATQATFAARPILRQTGGGLYYLEFDGTDDVLLMGDVFDAKIATASGKWDTYAAASYDADGILLAKLGDSNQGENQRQYASLRRAFGKTAQVALYDLARTPIEFTRVVGSAVSAGQNYVFRSVFDHDLAASGTTANDSSRHKMWKDGVLETLTVDASSGNLGTVQNGTAQLSIGGAYGTSGPINLPFSGKLFGLITLAGVVESDAVADEVEAYLAAKSGVTL